MLEKEIQIFEQKLASLLREREGQFVLIKGEQIDFFKTEKEAIEAGLEKYGATAHFLVREITAHRPNIDIPAFSFGLLNANF